MTPKESAELTIKMLAKRKSDKLYKARRDAYIGGQYAKEHAYSSFIKRCKRNK